MQRGYNVFCKAGIPPKGMINAMKKNKFTKQAAAALSLCMLGMALASCGRTVNDVPVTDKPATPDSGITPPSTTDIAPVTTPTVTTKAEVTTEPVPAHKIEQKDGIWYVDGVLIANKSYPLPEDYNPGKLLPEAEEAFKKMQSDAARDGIKLTIVSGFRSYNRQKNLYNSYVNKDGKAEADRYSARPGYSEHQSGLAMDLNSVDDSFAYTKEAKWIAENCSKYGFIIRYPKGKEPITGYIYEPWHVRYLGTELAEKVTTSGLTLEEYFGITSFYKD